MTANSKFQHYMSDNTDASATRLMPQKPKEPEMVEVDRNDIETKAKILVCHDFNTTFFPDAEKAAEPRDFYVVIKAKVLGTWKVLVSTDLISGQYWELTYNGAKSETYIDHYVKRSNKAISDEAYAALP